MKTFGILVAICCLSRTAKAKPGYSHDGGRLEAIPDLQTFGAIKFPSYGILDLGESSKGIVPGDQIHETKHITIKEPQPYPVKIPVPQPYPVHVPKPYPVVETKLVKVPQPVPYEVVKHVPVHVEVPKPYPVHGHGDLHHAGSGHSYGVQQIADEAANLVSGGHDHLSSLEAPANQEADGASYGGDEQAGQQDWQPIESQH